jgi:hypothetical protein
MMQPYDYLLRQPYIERLMIMVTRATVLAAALTPSSDDTIS